MKDVKVNTDTDKRAAMLLFAAIFACALLLALLWAVHFSLVNAKTPAGSSDPEAIAAETAPDVQVSHSSGYYSCGIELEMYPPEGYDILYTVTLSLSRNQTDGRSTPTGEGYTFSGGLDPDPENVAVIPKEYDVAYFNSVEGKLSTHLYTKPVTLSNPSSSNPLVVSVKAALYKGKLQMSPVSCFTYILGNIDGSTSFEEQFGSMLIIITIDESLLYDYERGIFISGKKYDDALAAGTAIDPWTPRNYNQRGRDWERLAHIDFYEADGAKVLSQICGIRVAGGTSRGAACKSLKLCAGEQYDGNRRFNYPFFEGARDSNGNPINSFKKLILRNPRNDIGGSMIRDQLIHKLGGAAGVDYQEGRDAVVYMNGKYYGLMCLHESLDTDYQEDHYFVNPDNVACFLIRSDQYQFRYKQESGTPEMFSYFISDMNYLIKNDFSAQPLEKIAEVIDVDNFCRYMAFQLYIVNADWPHNNVLVWRYYGPENDSVKAMDGRWRFVLKDLDFGLLEPEKETFSPCLNDGLYGGEPCIGTVLKNLLRNPEFRRIFRQACLDVCEAMDEDYVIGMIDAAVDSISLDMVTFARYNGMSYQAWLEYSDGFRDFARRRPGYFLKYLDIFAPAD